MRLRQSRPCAGGKDASGRHRFNFECGRLGEACVAYDPYDPANCNGGVEWDDQRTLVVSKVTAKPRINYVKSPYDDDFKAENCPAATEACRKKSYLVTDDLVLTGRTRREFTCVPYHSPVSNKRIWAMGWLPSAALKPVAPMQSPKPTDWVGTWRQGQRYVGGGLVEIKLNRGGKLHVDDPIEYYRGWNGYWHPISLDHKISKEEADALHADLCRVDRLHRQQRTWPKLFGM
jgi:hypothetical protein